MKLILLVVIFILSIFRYMWNDSIYREEGYDFKDSGGLSFGETKEEIERANENFIAFLFCLFTLFWLRKGRLELKVNLSSLISLILVVVMIFT